MTAIPELLVEKCPLCGSQKSAVLDQRVLHDYQLINRLCSGCGLVYLSPRLSEKQLLEFYARDYRRLYHGVAEPTSQDLAVQGRRGRFLINFVQANAIHTIRRHLDIGCSTGTLLQVFARQFGCASTGVELDDSHRAYAQKQGLTVYPERDRLPPPGGRADDPKYDLVSLIHVLEHLPDPIDSLIDIRKNLLEPSGWLLLEVPNLYAHDSFEIAHLVSFSRMTLIQTIQQAGFTPVKVIAHGHPRSRLIPLYITLLARPLAAPPPSGDGRPSPLIRPEKGVRFKRMAGMRFRWLVERLFPAWAWLPAAERDLGTGERK